MSPDLVSIIIPMYNASHTIKRCLDSILLQTYPNIEIILIDDGSTDDSLQVAKKYSKNDKRFKILAQTKSGVSTARNLGLQIASGDYICFIDADDSIKPSFIQTLLNKIKDTHSEVAICNVNFIYGKHIKRPLKLKSGTINQYDYMASILHDAQGFTSNKFYSKSFINEQRFNPEISICEDFLFNAELGLKLKQAAVINLPLYNYYQTNTSATRSMFTENSSTELLANKKILSIIKKSFPKLIPEYTYEFILSACRQKFFCKKVKKYYQNEYYKIKTFIKQNKSNVYHTLTLPQKTRIFIYEHFYQFVQLLKNIKHNLG